jgi:CheY-like chemotaxis protein
VGIAPDRLGAIFDGPVPADGSPSRPYGGGGLNLGICRHLVSLMGGELSASSEPGRGSTFSLVVTLPVEAAPAGPAQPATPRRILLAEDHPVNQQVAGAMLRRRGHHVDIVGNGRLAVDAVRRDVYDVVLMDVQMPELDGLGATRQIRALGGAFETLRIVALTAHEAVDQRAQCEAAGMNAFVTKPFRPADLFEVVETHPPADAARGPAADPAEEPGAPAVDLEGFRATMREAGVEDLVEATLRTYLAETPARLAAMEAAVAAADGRGVQEAAHAVKSSAASIGAGGLAALMRRAEAAGRAGDIDACRTLWPRIAAAAAAVERQISPVAAGAEQ